MAEERARSVWDALRGRVLFASLLLVGCAAHPVPRDGGETAAPDTPSTVIRASRIFAGPGEYSPGSFAAYGVVAFRSASTPQSFDRYLAICTGYLAGLPSAAELEAHDVPLAEQMATVWPVADRRTAYRLNERRRPPDCRIAVENIGLVASLDAIQKARGSRPDEELAGEGPYLLAWSPSSTMGQPDALVLVWDMSDVTTVGQAREMFADWAVEIERDPELWTNGWNVDRVRLKLRFWADKYGEGILRALGSLGG